MVTESKGPWTAIARLASPDEGCDGIVTLSRNGSHVGTFSVYRFPIGWRGGSILRAKGINATGKAMRAMKQLP